MAAKRITRKKLKNDFSVQLVNCRSILKTPLYKYMSAGRVLRILEETPHQIGFVSPETWNDPYETKYLKTDYTSLGGYQQPTVYCFCARMDNSNEEASWKIYKKKDEPLLRLTINTEAFLLSISNFASANDCDVYFAKVDYRLKTAEIDGLYKTASPYYHDFFDHFDDKQFVRVMSLKRQAFSYEKEYRIFIIPNDVSKIEPYLNNGVLYIPIDVSMISRCTFYPAEKIKDNLESQIQQVKYEAEYKYIKKRIQDAFSVKVYKSSLYSKTKGVKEIEV